MRKVSLVKIKPGFVLVMPVQAGYGDATSGLVYQTLENKETSIGLIVKTHPDDTEHCVGMEVAYRRVTAVDLRLQDDDDIEQPFKMVDVLDIIATFEKDDESGL